MEILQLSNLVEVAKDSLIGSWVSRGIVVTVRYSANCICRVGDAPIDCGVLVIKCYFTFAINLGEGIYQVRKIVCGDIGNLIIPAIDPPFREVGGNNGLCDGTAIRHLRQLVWSEAAF